MSILRDLDPRATPPVDRTAAANGWRYMGWGVLVVIALILLWVLANVYDAGSLLNSPSPSMPSTAIPGSADSSDVTRQGGQPVASNSANGQTATRGEAAPSAAVILGSMPAQPGDASPKVAGESPVPGSQSGEVVARKVELTGKAPVTTKPALVDVPGAEGEKDRVSSSIVKKPPISAAEKSKAAKLSSGDGRPAGSEKKAADRDIEIITAIVK